MLTLILLAMFFFGGKIFPKFDVKNYDFNLYKRIFHGQNYPNLLDFEGENKFNSLDFMISSSR
jgi:hypothetical protein